MATGIKAVISSVSTDLDSLFKARTSTKRADVGYKSNGNVDISNRFEPSTGGDTRANIGIKSGGADLATLFRDINYSPPPPPAVPSCSISGPTAVSAADYGTAVWSFSATSTIAMTFVRFRIVGQSPGWTAFTGTSYSGTATWSSSFGSPNIAGTPGTYTFVFEAQNASGTGSASINVTVS